MEQVSMNDGLDGRETLAFGLAAGEVAVFVLALLGAYAVLRSGLPAAAGWTLALCLCASGALLSWGRIAGRPMVEWAGLVASFALRTRHQRLARARRRIERFSAAAATAAAALSGRATPAGPERGGAARTGAVVIPLALRRTSSAADGAAAGERAARRAPHVVGFFSLAGGTGRTTLAVEAGSVLAVRAAAAAASGGPRTHVAVLDLARRSPCVGLRLGMPFPCGGPAPLTRHETGLLVRLAPASTVPLQEGDMAASLGLVESAGQAGAGIVIVDFDCDGAGLCHALVRRCDQLLVVMTPTAGGMVDAYRSTAVLRRLGLGRRVGHVLNRGRPGVDLAETMADLGGTIAAAIPDDDAFLRAEDHHRPVGLGGEGPAAVALEQLARCVERAAGVDRAGIAAAPAHGHAG